MDIVGYVVAHLKADATLVALLGSASRIRRELATSEAVLSPLFPQVYVSPAGGIDDNPASTRPRVSIWAESKKASTCAAIHKRIYDILNEATNYTLGTGANSIFCIRSMRGGPPDIERLEANGPFESQAFYDFNVNT